MDGWDAGDGGRCDGDVTMNVGGAGSAGGPRDGGPAARRGAAVDVGIGDRVRQDEAEDLEDAVYEELSRESAGDLVGLEDVISRVYRMPTSGSWRVWRRRRWCTRRSTGSS